MQTLRATGYEPHVVHQAEENHTQVALVAAGLGIAMVPRLGRGALSPEVTPVTETVRTLQELWPQVASATT